MPSVVVRLSYRFRQTGPFFSRLFRPAIRARATDDAADQLIYRLKHWPRLPSSCRTADIFRALSMMSNRPVNRRWILNHSTMPAHEVDGLLHRLVEQGAVDVTDAGRYGTDPNAG